MDRREFLAGATSLVVAAAAATARGESHEHHADAAATLPGPRDPKLVEVVAAAFACDEAAEACVRHCVEYLGRGDRSLHGCMQSVLPMSAVCTALARISSYADLPDKNLQAYAVVCAGYCRDCAAACKEHAEHHAPCKACMDACERCAKACDALVA